ncbi:BspA family leucine-rich repeat surface protein [Kordia algicida OT-1]|uniref:Transmembrane protein, putative n=1 Tax=Kordia algicida OT-1 TaxID=391587 RepID=A9DVD3_9FLAO|nr:BspA family leucine-rich repeat surface protein [Kordia algicida]EDP96406.1 transmembrane protein, putative [Kordia algicida OT-1]
MKKLYLTIILICSQNFALAQDFITTWQTTANNELITIPTFPGETYNYDVNWGDGNFSTGVTGNITHTYTLPGNYQVSISGTFPRIYVNNNNATNTLNQLISIDQWGNQQWTSMAHAFSNCQNLSYNATDIPDLSNVTDLTRMFLGPTTFNTSIVNWDVSTITNMESLFRGTSFNQDISGWDVSNVTDMSWLFAGSDFNQDISSWDVSNVTDMAWMFSLCPFNQDIGNWNVSNVTSMLRMFNNNVNFNQDISNWDVSNVIDFTRMFGSAESFNQDISSWDTSSATNMSLMFFDAIIFNQDLSSWNIENVTSFSNMFRDSGLSTVNYSNTLIGWSTQTVNPNVTLGAHGINYNCSADIARDILTSAPNNWIITDAGLETGLSCDLILEANVYLQGAALNPNIGEETLMRDDLRIASLIPTTSPYADMLTCNPTVFNVTGNNAIVDWIWVELRDDVDNTTIVQSQSAFLQRDGDIVSVDGTSALSFNVSSANYYIAVHHRNHLSIMSSNTIALSSTATTVNFYDASITTFGSNAQVQLSNGNMALWAGNVNSDTFIQYAGANADSPSILSEVLNDPGNFLNFPTYVVNGYNVHDVNLDGGTQYTGTSPDTPVLLQNVLAHPENFLNFSTYQIQEQLPEN